MANILRIYIPKPVSKSSYSNSESFFVVHISLKVQYTSTIVFGPSHRGLKLDGAIGQGEICNSLKSEIFQNPSCPILEKIK